MLNYCGHGGLLDTASFNTIGSFCLQDVLDKLVATVDALTTELEQAKITSAQQAEQILTLSEQLDSSKTREKDLKKALERARNFESSALGKEIDPTLLFHQEEKIRSLSEQLGVSQARGKELEKALGKSKSEQSSIPAGANLEAVNDSLLTENEERRIRNLSEQPEAAQSRANDPQALNISRIEESPFAASPVQEAESPLLAEKDEKIQRLSEELEASHAREADLKDALEKAKNMQSPGKPVIIPRLALSTLHEHSDTAPAPEAPKPLCFKTAPSGLSDTSSEGAATELIGAVRRRASALNKNESRPLGPVSARKRRGSTSSRSPTLNQSRSGGMLSARSSSQASSHHEEFAPSCRITMAARAGAAVRAKKNAFSGRKKIMTPRVMQASAS